MNLPKRVRFCLEASCYLIRFLVPPSWSFPPYLCQILIVFFLISNFPLYYFFSCYLFLLIFLRIGRPPISLLSSHCLFHLSSAAPLMRHHYWCLHIAWHILLPQIIIHTSIKNHCTQQCYKYIFPSFGRWISSQYYKYIVTWPDHCDVRAVDFAQM